MKLTKEIVQKIKETVECGLSSGLGRPVPGEMCIEAAVCYAYGLPHSDNPSCVGSAVREFLIRLNDSNWSSNKARANGMLKLSIAQLNSSTLDQKKFARKVTIGIINKIIAPLAAKYYPELQEKLTLVTDPNEAVILCRELEAKARLSDIAAAEAANAAANAAAKAAFAAAEAAYVAAAADYAAAAKAAYAAVANAYVAAKAAKAADAAAEAADAAAEATAYAIVAEAAYAVIAAADAAATGDDARDKVLIQASDICLDVLKEMKSPGCNYLYLCNSLNIDRHR